MALRVFVDFHNADRQGRVRLNTVGSLRDLTAYNLQTGVALQLYDDETELAGFAEYSSEERIWTAVVDWSKFNPP
jgi:hypothetical protein